MWKLLIFDIEVNRNKFAFKQREENEAELKNESFIGCVVIDC